MRKTIDPAEIARAYDASPPLWDAFNDGQVHLAYWYDDHDDTPLAEAAQRITRRAAQSLGLRAGERLLDAGCGLGAPALLVAAETGAHVTGITVSAVQVDQARARASAAGMDGQVRFDHGDFMALPYGDGTFDAVMAVESLEYAPDLAQVVGELHRVLRPGGRACVADLSTQQGADPTLVDRLAEEFRINRPPTLAEWSETFFAAGFQPAEHLECGPRVYGVKAKYLQAIAERRTELRAAIGDEAITELEQKFHRFLAPGPANIGYLIITVQKPGL